MKYLAGLGNHFESEALPGAIPQGQNSPQRVRYGLYAEQFSATAFTAKRSENLRSWLYRISPSVKHGPFSPREGLSWQTMPWTGDTSPEQMRWNPPAEPVSATSFLEGVTTIAGNGSAEARVGSGLHLYQLNRSMDAEFFLNADADLLFVPQKGSLLLKSEMGSLELEPCEIAQIPRGIKFQVCLGAGVSFASGYLCENFGHPFRLPGLGPIGANGLAEARDFLAPVASFEDRPGQFRLVKKFLGKFWQAELEASPFDVVGWRGNLAPWKYDLRKFQAVGSISFDHPDPSIWTVLTSPTEREGVANLDFVIFPPRWYVQEHTFRPPYYHRNTMSEFMGLIHGAYDAKETGFVPGGYSLHNCMAAHGPDERAFEKASSVELKPQYLGDTMAFMFESFYAFRVTSQAQQAKNRQRDYLNCWQSLRRGFDPGA